MNCREVEEHIELFAAGECPPAIAVDVERHMATCAACRQCVAETRQLLALLDQRFHEPERLRRLQARLDAVDRRAPLRYRWLAAAAALLLAVGLGWWLIPRLPTGQPPLVQKPALVGVVVVWASPGAQWQALTGRKIELSAGELWLRSSPVAVALAPIEVVTPAGVATARGTEFIVAVRPPSAKGDPEMRLKTMVTVTVLGGLVGLTNALGTASGERGDVLAAEPGSAPARQVEGLARRFGKHYQPVKFKADARIPAYELPLDPDKVANYASAAKALGLPADEPSLRKNGFVVLPGKDNDDIVAPYKHLFAREVPIFVTTDTVLHLYHIQFDETLREIEEREFYPDMVALTRGLIAQLETMKLPADTDDFRGARAKALTCLAIALKSFDPEAALPKGVDAKDVATVLEKMKKHEGFWPAPAAAHQEWPLFRYAEDFSQYVPRGHYTRSENLKRYFVGMMWLGRMTFVLKGDATYGPGAQPALVSVQEADQQTLAATMLTKLLAQAELPDQRKARDVWERIYAVTSFYVGLADDLGVQEYQAALAKVCGTALDLGQLNEGKKLLALRAELAKHQPPAIYSGTGGQVVVPPDAGPEALAKTLGKTAGFRLMGQRFVPDSYMMGKMVFPTVGPGTRNDVFTASQSGPNRIVRGFPRGLDVMAVLGSKRARAITHELGDDAYVAQGTSLSYDQALESLQKEYAGLSDSDWNRNLYWS